MSLLCFNCVLNQIGKAVLQYENEAHDTMNMYHTHVPSEYRGQGIAGHLAKVSGMVKHSVILKACQIV